MDDKKKQKKEQLDDVIETATKLGEIEELQLELAKVQAEHEEIRNQLKRAVADYQNLERRVNEGRAELSSFVSADLIKRLLQVLDHLELATKGVSEEEQKSGWFRGVELAVKQFKEVLKEEGLDEIVADGQFDPSQHEAVDTRDGDDNMILETVRKGYNLNKKVLRPAQVVVGRKEK